jgi:hypothetical protein
MPNNTTATLTAELQDMIAAEMLIQPDDAYLFYANGPVQLAGQEAAIPGTNQVLFNRPVLPTGTYTETSRRLTDGTDIDLTGVAITETQVTLTLREYGGPHDGTRVTPYILTEFLKKTAKHNLVAMVGEFMRRDYNRWQDVTTRDLMLAATTVVTPDGSTSATIGAGVKASVAWLRSWNKTMKDSKIPTYPNGRWRMMLTTKDESDLKADPEYREAMKHLAGANPLFNGHVMSIENFDIMISTMYSTTAVGDGGGVDGYQSTAWGPYGIGHARPMPPGIRQGDSTDFGRKESVVWVSHEIIGTLYADLMTRGITT